MIILDLSEHQSGIKLNTLTGVDGFIFRASIGDSRLDACVEDFIAQAKELGKPYGLYVADYAKDVTEAASEANYVCDLADRYGVDFPIFFDTEGFSNEYITNTFGISHTPELVQSMTTYFCETVKSRGYTAGVYFNKNYHDNYYTAPYFASHPDYVKWLARPGVEEPDITCDLWQYASDNGAEFGYDANVDQNLVINEAVFSVTRTYQKFKFPMEYLRVTQRAGFNADGSVDTTSYSHAGSWAVDFAGQDEGSDKLYLPCDMIVKRCRTAANGELYLESVDPVWFADGTKDYAKMVCLHDSEFNVAAGDVLKQGTYFYDEGGIGSGDPNKFGIHVHIEAGKGKWKSTTQSANAQGTYVMEDQSPLYELFIVGDDVVIMDEGGYDWISESEFDAGIYAGSDAHLFEACDKQYKVLVPNCEYFNSADVNDVAGKFTEGSIITAHAISKEIIGEYYYWLKVNFDSKEYYVALVENYLEEIVEEPETPVEPDPEVPEEPTEPDVPVDPEPEEPTPEGDMPNVIKVIDVDGLVYFYGKIKADIAAGADHSKVEHAPVDAEKNTIVGLTINGKTVTISGNRIVDITVPTSVSQLSDASEYLKASDISPFTIEEIDEICK